jgi:hypothetical protein
VSKARKKTVKKARVSKDTKKTAKETGAAKDGEEELAEGYQLGWYGPIRSEE